MSTLYIVATPIGNLEDITLRALRILGEVDLIAAEDTRQTKKLLDRYQIKAPLISYREAAPRVQVEAIIDRILSELEAGKDIAYVSDSGTPGVSDPGQYLVRRVVEAGLTVSPIPGPSALVASLSVAGTTASKVLFLGFLPKKKGRQTLIKQLAKAAGKAFDTIVFYENQHRLKKSLEELANNLPKIDQVIIGRELTKFHEEIMRGSLTEILKELSESSNKLKGEFVVIVSFK